MFNDYQLLLLQKERERELARQWRKQGLPHEAKQATRGAIRGAVKRHHEQALKQVVLRTLSIALLVVLLALALTRIASAQAAITLPECQDSAGNLDLAQDN